jgi:nitroreductase
MTDALYMRRRSVRQFQAKPVPRELLMRLADSARLAPSAANRQPLEFIILDDPAVCAKVFPHLGWAAYISPAGNPLPGQEPRAYVVTLVNTAVRDKGCEYDVGAAVMSMIMTAWAEGVASCWLISVDRAGVARLLGIPETHRLDSVLALGYPAEFPQVEDLTDSVQYWKDAEGRLHVPKRKLESVVHLNKF